MIDRRIKTTSAQQIYEAVQLEKSLKIPTLTLDASFGQQSTGKNRFLSDPIYQLRTTNLSNATIEDEKSVATISMGFYQIWRHAV